MFKNIGNIIDKKKILILRAEDKTGEIKKSLKSFIENRFGDTLTGFSFIINYNSKDDRLTITTENKILANEFTILLADIHEHLKRNGIIVGSILIR